ncbi:MAG: 50S ribosomal protein L21 [Phycisphaerales bacterium]|nr:50S ribosomal protein L21 [Phycisphaerales bacterium]
MYAIIEESGGQRKVTQGEEILIDLYKGGEGATGEAITFDKVLIVGPEGGAAKVGTPYVAGATVSAEVVEPSVLGEKLNIHKFKPKTGYRRKTGHRQRYTRVKITGIVG